MEKMKVIEVYSDGSATTAAKPGGYAWVMVVDGVKHSEGSGHVVSATNNDMELESAIQGLSAVLKYILLSTSTCEDPEKSKEIARCEVILVSDSQITLGWASGTYRFKQESKIEKYKQLKGLMESLNAKTRWVKGHSGDPYNSRCDLLANNARKGLMQKSVINPDSLKNSLIGTKKEGVFCVWWGDKLKIICLTNNAIEDYNREIHGKRGSAIEIRQERMR